MLPYLLMQKIEQEKLMEEAEIICYDLEGDMIKLTSNQEHFPEYHIKKDLLMEAFETDEMENIDDILTSKVPFKCQFVLSENGMDKFSLILE